jgi:hypothetical protein
MLIKSIEHVNKDDVVDDDDEDDDDDDDAKTLLYRVCMCIYQR